MAIGADHEGSPHAIFPQFPIAFSLPGPNVFLGNPFLKNLTLHSYFDPLNAELNPICHLLALLGAHHILHISRIRVKLTDRVWHPYRPTLLSAAPYTQPTYVEQLHIYIYIYIYIYI